MQQFKNNGQNFHCRLSRTVAKWLGRVEKFCETFCLLLIFRIFLWFSHWFSLEKVGVYNNRIFALVGFFCAFFFNLIMLRMIALALNPQPPTAITRMSKAAWSIYTQISRRALVSRHSLSKRISEKSLICIIGWIRADLPLHRFVPEKSNTLLNCAVARGGSAQTCD